MVGLFWYTSQMCLVQFLFAQIFSQAAVAMLHYTFTFEGYINVECSSL